MTRVQVTRPVLVPGTPIDQDHLELTQLGPLREPAGGDRAAGPSTENHNAVHAVLLLLQVQTC